MEIHERLKSVRQALGYKQRDFAIEIDFNPSYLSEMESGKKKVTARIAKKLFEKFQVSSEWLMNETGSMFLANSEQKVVNNVGNSSPVNRQIKMLKEGRIEERDREAPEGQKRQIKMLKNEREQAEGELGELGAILVASEDDLKERVRDLELSLDRLHKQIMFFSETWWHLLRLDYNWMSIESYELPRKTIDIPGIYGEDGGLLMKDGILLKEYDLLNLNDKILYFRELEGMHAKWQYDLGRNIYNVYMAVLYGDQHFNKLVNGDESTPVSDEKKAEIKERLNYFSEGMGMERIHPERRKGNKG